MSGKIMLKILFVCTGNICRSPTAHGILRHKVMEEGLDDRIEVDSAGMHGYHVGESPDGRSIEVARDRGIKLHDLVARQVTTNDFSDFDIILGMDDGHYRSLQHITPEDTACVVDLFLPYATVEDVEEVPDPYYGERDDFEYVYDLIKRGVDGMLDKIKKEHQL